MVLATKFLPLKNLVQKIKIPGKALNLGCSFNYKNFPGKFIYFDFDLFMMIKKIKIAFQGEKGAPPFDLQRNFHRDSLKTRSPF